MRVRFVGDPADGFSGPPAVTFFGITFPKGEWVEVPDGDARFVNSHMEVEPASEEKPRGRRVKEEGA